MKTLLICFLIYFIVGVFCLIYTLYKNDIQNINDFEYKYYERYTIVIPLILWPAFLIYYILDYATKFCGLIIGLVVEFIAKIIFFLCKIVLKICLRIVNWMTFNKISQRSK